MSRKIIQKIIDELKTDKPDLSYIRGILETLIESLPLTDEDYLKKIPVVKSNPSMQYETIDEAAALDAQARAAMGKINLQAIKND